MWAGFDIKNDRIVIKCSLTLYRHKGNDKHTYVEHLRKNKHNTLSKKNKKTHTHANRFCKILNERMIVKQGMFLSVF